jgi:hypothetical protein
LKISVLKRIEALHLPADTDWDASENAEGDVILTLKFPKNDMSTPAPVQQRTRQRKTRNPGEKDIPSTFAVKTPMDNGPQTISMGGKEVKSNDLRKGVLEMLDLHGITTELLLACPESEGKKQIIKILG